MAKPQLGRYGLFLGKDRMTPDLARHADELGFGAVWLGRSPDAGDLEPLLAATEHLVVATGIVNIWQSDPKTTAATFNRLDADYPGRALLGVGAGHREATQEYTKPYQALSDYVDVLRDEGVAAERIVLAALGPRVLELSGDRTAGAHPYLVPAEHSRIARDLLGPDALLAPEHKAVLDTDAERARDIGRAKVAKPYLELSNYVANLRRLGWSDADLASPGSDALIDALVAHGDDDEVKRQLDAHLDAGADHVAVQLLADDLVDGYNRLATALHLEGNIT